MSQMYDLVLTQLAENYEFVIKDDGSGLQLKMKVIGIMPLMDKLDKHISNQDLNILDY